jgi:hypothetical protein
MWQPVYGDHLFNVTTISLTQFHYSDYSIFYPNRETTCLMRPRFGTKSVWLYKICCAYLRLMHRLHGWMHVYVISDIAAFISGIKLGFYCWIYTLIQSYFMTITGKEQKKHRSAVFSASYPGKHTLSQEVPNLCSKWELPLDLMIYFWTWTINSQQSSKWHLLVPKAST